MVGWAEVLEVVKGLKAKLAFLFSKTSSLAATVIARGLAGTEWGAFCVKSKLSFLA